MNKEEAVHLRYDFGSGDKSRAAVMRALREQPEMFPMVASLFDVDGEFLADEPPLDGSESSGERVVKMFTAHMFGHPDVTAININDGINRLSRDTAEYVVSVLHFIGLPEETALEREIREVKKKLDDLSQAQDAGMEALSSWAAERQAKKRKR
jgi:hypothetical protein